MKTIFSIFTIISLIISFNLFPETKTQTEVYSDTSEGQRFTNSVAVGIIFSAMSKCVGENPDSEIAKVAGSLLVSTAIAEFHKAKLDQIDPYTYTYDQTGLVNDAQKLSLTGEQIVNNQKYLNVLKDKRYSEESVKKSLMVAESVALRELRAMDVHEADCLAGIYEGAYRPIWRDHKTMPDHWAYGKCETDWGDSHHIYSDACPKWKAAENAYKSAIGTRKAEKLKAELDAARAICQRGANATANRSRIAGASSPEACLTLCGVAAQISLECKPVQRIVREYGLPTIKSLLNTIEPSSYNAAKILRVHHNTFTKMFQVCKRDEVLDVLKNIKSVSTKYDPQFEKIRGDSAEVYQKYGGLASSDLNKYRTDVNRSADDVHKADVGEKPNEEDIKKFNLAKENLFNDIPVDTTIVGEGKPTCGDWAARGCGEYSKLLMKSLNSCSETLHNTVYNKMYNEVINHYAATPSKDLIYYDDILKTFKYFTQNGMNLFLENAHAKTFTDSVGGAIGLGGKWLSILRQNQRNLIDTFDPLLSTYNKRILAYQIAIDLIDLSLTNTKKSISKVENRLVELVKIKSTLDKTRPLPSMPILSAEITKDVDHKFKEELKNILNFICNSADCSEINKKVSDSISAPVNNPTSAIIIADKNILKAADIISSVGDSLFKEKNLSRDIQNKLSNLDGMGDVLYKSKQVLETNLSKSQDENSKLLDMKNRIFKILSSEDAPLDKRLAEVPPTPSVSTDVSIYYTLLKDNKPQKPMAIPTATLDASEELVEYEELNDQNFYKLQNDIISNDEITLWQIISNRYLKTNERLYLWEEQ